MPRKTLICADLLIRVVAGILVIPLVLFVLFLSIMATDSPRSGFFPALVVLAVAAGPMWLLILSCTDPGRIARRLEPYIRYSNWIARAPAYLYVPIGLYFGVRFLAGILVNVKR